MGFEAASVGNCDTTCRPSYATRTGSNREEFRLSDILKFEACLYQGVAQPGFALLLGCRNMGVGGLFRGHVLAGYLDSVFYF